MISRRNGKDLAPFAVPRRMRSLLIASMIVAATGCVAAPWFCTGIFASRTDGREILVSNFHGDQGSKFAIYRLASGEDSDDLEWRQAASYYGRVSAVAALDGALWAFFDDGAYRTYDVSTDNAVQLASGRIGVKWSPLEAEVDSRGRLWVIGIEEGRLAVAMLMGDTWKRRFPPGPRIAEAAEDMARNLLITCKADGELKVFWHIRGQGHSVMGAALQLAGDDPALPGASWRDLPDLALAVPDLRIDTLLAAPSSASAGSVMLLVRGGVPALGNWMHGSIWHASLKGDPPSWSAPELIPDSAEPFRFGGVGGMAWLDRSDGGTLLSSNAQRGRVFRLQGETWRPLRHGTWIRLYLPEIEVLALLVSAGALTLVGSVVFGLRLRRLRKAGFRRPSAGYEKSEPVPASVSARLLSAAFDLMLVTGIIMMLPTRYSPPANPLLPELMAFARHAATVAALIGYGIITEATLGATFGKLAMGLRVVRADGSRAGFWRIAARNVFRLIDTGVLGIIFVMVTRKRQRLGDIAADTVVAAVGFRKYPEEEA